LRILVADSEVESDLAPDSFVFVRDSSLRVRSVQNDKQVAVILSDSVAILSPSSFGKLRRLRVNSANNLTFNFGIRDYAKVSYETTALHNALVAVVVCGASDS
jgi:hypothetical protein